MFRFDNRIEEHMTPSYPRLDPNLFQLAMRTPITPLWQVHILTNVDAFGELPVDADPIWGEALVCRSDHAAIIGAKSRADAKLYVTLPGQLTKSEGPVFAKCLAIWECCSLTEARSPVWYFQTDCGSYFDPFFPVPPGAIKTVALRWWRKDETMLTMPPKQSAADRQLGDQESERSVKNQ